MSKQDINKKRAEKLFPSYILAKPYVAIHCISPIRLGWFPNFRV